MMARTTISGARKAASRKRRPSIKRGNLDRKRVLPVEARFEYVFRITPLTYGDANGAR
jgi:hypothetical protein